MIKPSPATQTPSIPMFVKAALVGTCCFSISNIAFAEWEDYSAGFPYTPGFTVMGLAGTNSTGYLDAMVPALGTPTTFLYVDPQILFTNNTYTASFGTGFRHLTDSVGILGAYIFADYNHSSNSNGFWFASPGIERLGKTVDFSANVYIPIGTQSQNVSSETGQEMGTNNFLTFSQHSQFDALFTTFEAVGTGADAEIGFRLPLYNNPKLYVGTYYFSPQDVNDNITGITGRVEMPLTDKLTFVLSDGYDKEEGNTVKLGLSYNFGGRRNSKFFTDDLFTDNHFADDRFSSDLTRRMVDPVHRNLIAISGSSDTGQPIATGVTQTNGAVLVQGQIAFFDIEAPPGGDGTFEKPFNTFNQTNVNLANGGGNVNLFVDTGTYLISSPPITLTNDNIFGRQDDANGNTFAETATGANRPVFSFNLTGSAPGFTLVGNNSFDSVSLSNATMAGVGISITNPANQTMAFSLTNSTVNNFSTGLNILANNTGSVLSTNIGNSTFSGNATGLNLAANSGMATINATSSMFNNNTVNGLNVATNSGTLIINPTGSTFNGNAVNGLNVTTNNPNSFLTINANNSNFNNNTSAGLNFVTNNGTTVINATNGSTFNSNNIGLNFTNNFGTATINTTGATFDNNVTGLNVSTNNAGSPLFAITTVNSHFDNNTSTGLNFSTNSGTTAQINTTGSTFNGNGTGLTSGTGLNVSTNDVGSTFTITTDSSSFDNNILTGLSFLNNSGTANINLTNNSTFNTNGTMGASVGTGLNFANNFGSATINAANSTFNANGTSSLAGLGLNVGLNAVGATFSIATTDSSFDNNITNGLNFSTNSGTTAQITATNSTFNNNVTGLDVARNNAGATFTINTNNSIFENNNFVGLFVGDNFGAVTVNPTASSFNSNATGPQGAGLGIGTNEAGATFSITSDTSTFNNNVTTSVSTLGAGLYINNFGTATMIDTGSSFDNNEIGAFLLNNNPGKLLISTTNSNFNGNTSALTDQGGVFLVNSSTSTGGVIATLTNSNFNNNAGSGFLFNNNQSGQASFMVNGSNFNANASVGLGLVSVNGQLMTATINTSTFNGNLGEAFGGANSGGLYVTNDANVILPSPSIAITVNSNFVNNNGYGIYATNVFEPAAVAPTPFTITRTGSTYSGNTIANAGPSSVAITWNPALP